MTLAITVLDVVTSADVTLVPLLVVGPLLAAATTDTRGSAFVGAVAVIAAVALGIAAGEAGSADAPGGHLDGRRRRAAEHHRRRHA